MSIPKAPTLIENRLDGFEQNAFSIASNRKAFRVLIDTLYTNKERAVIREIWTNAYDSHVEAGKADVPFTCQLPTMLDPNFRVRDYGVSLSHDDVMKLYSTVFQSTKEETNELVGQLGLGSKSPFAYTDSFTVTAWLDGEKRQYIASLGVDGIPTITSISKEPTDEPDGLQVSFPVQHRHIQTFMAEAKNVVRGFDVPPIIEGIEFDIPEPVLTGDNWKIYYSASGMATSIRQGCVLYPVNRDQLIVRDVTNHAYSVVVTVPIGSCEVAASREALSLDDETSELVRKAFSDSASEIEALVMKQYTDAPNLLAATALFKRNHDILARTPVIQWGSEKSKWTLNGTIRFDRRDPDEPVIIGHDGKVLEAMFNYQDIRFLVFVIDRGQPILRRNKRIATYLRERNTTHRKVAFRINNPTNKQLERLVRRLGLRQDQLISVATLPDVLTYTPGTTGRGTRSGVYVNRGDDLAKPPTDISAGDAFYWAPIDKGLPNSHTYIFGTHVKVSHITTLLRNVGLALGFPDQPLYLLTSNARKRLQVTEDTNLASMIETKIEEVEKGLCSYHKVATINSMLSVDLGNFIEELVGDEYEVYKTWMHVGRSHHCTNAFNYRFSTAVSTAKTEGRRHLNDIREAFPLLFPGPDSKHIEEYIQSKKHLLPQAQPQADGNVNNEEEAA